MDCLVIILRGPRIGQGRHLCTSMPGNWIFMVNSFGQETKRKTVVSVTLCGCELKRRSSNIIILRRLFPHQRMAQVRVSRDDDDHSPSKLGQSFEFCPLRVLHKPTGGIFFNRIYYYTSRVPLLLRTGRVGWVSCFAIRDEINWWWCWCWWRIAKLSRVGTRNNLHRRVKV